MKQTIKAITFTEPQKVEIGTFDLPTCGRDDIVVRTIYSFISTGTELRVLSGKQTYPGDASYYPVIAGYSTVGEVVEVGENAVGWRTGDLVSTRGPGRNPDGIRSCWGGQASMHVCPAAGSGQPVLLPPGADPLDYVAVELAAISHRGFRATAARPKETAVILGQGIVGATFAGWLSAAGVRVAVSDMSDSRLSRSAKWGASATFSAADPGVCERILAYTGGGADIVVESSASIAGVKLAGSLVRRHRISDETGPENWPRLVYQATYIDQYPVSPNSLFVGEGAVVLTPGDRSVVDRCAAVEAFRTGQLNPAAYCDKVLPISDAQVAYDGLRTKPDDFFSVAFDWRT